jgi:Family of unknown function (DUF6516)
MAKATLVYRDRVDWPDGHILEMTIWRLPAASEERPHGLKYSLFYGRAGLRIIGYDNEVGKGDHRHFLGDEKVYVFRDVETLVADFLADVRKERGEA